MGTWNGTELTGVELADHGLRLRRIVDSDAASVHAAMNHPAMDTRWLRLPDPYTAADARTFVERTAQQEARAGTGLQLAITPEPSGPMLGSVALRLPGEQGVRAEIGYSVYPAGQGRGYAALASRIVTRWAFEHGLGSVVIRCAVSNLASAKTALNAGFRYEGTARQSLPGANGPSDAATFARIAAEPDRPVPRAFAALPPGGLSDDMVTLRAVDPLDPADAAALIDERDNPEQRRWAFHDQQPTTWPEAARHIADAALEWLVGRSAQLVIVDVASQAAAGFVTIRMAGPPGVGGIGYGVRPAFRGRGYTARALRLVRGWALTDGGFHRLELGAKRDNVASQRAAASGGFSPEGVRAQRLRNPDGSYSDEVRFTALK